MYTERAGSVRLIYMLTTFTTNPGALYRDEGHWKQFNHGRHKRDANAEYTWCLRQSLDDGGVGGLRVEVGVEEERVRRCPP